MIVAGVLIPVGSRCPDGVKSLRPRTLAAGMAGVLLLGLLAPQSRAITIHAVDAGDRLYVLNTDGFETTLVGTMAIRDSPFSVQALAFDTDGRLYGLLLGSEATLYEIDPTNAAVTAIADLGTDYRLEGSMAFDPITRTMYAVNETSFDQTRLVVLDLLTGKSTPIGRIAGGVHDFAGLAFDAAGNLFGIDRNTDALWAIDRNDPQGPNTRQIGTGLGSGIVMGAAGGMTDDPAGGIYYGYAQESRQLFTVDLQSGLATVLHTFGPQDPQFLGLAYVNEVPTAARPVSWGSIKARHPGPVGD